MGPRVVGAWLLAASLLAGLPGRGAAAGPDPAEVAQQAIRIFDERDGLPQNTVESVAFDRQGRLWLGTQDGLLGYDGHALAPLALPGASVSSWVQAILPARDGSLWLGTYGNGLHRWRNGAWTSFNAARGVPLQRVTCLLEVPAGPDGTEILAATQGDGLWRVRGDRCERVDLPRMEAPPWIHALLRTVDGAGRPTLWLGTDRGLWSLEAGAWKHHDLKACGLASESVTSLLETREPSGPVLWVGTDHGLACRRGPAWSLGGGSAVLASTGVTALDGCTLPDGKVLVGAGTSRGLAFLDGRTWRFLDTRSGLPSNRIQALRITLSGGGQPEIWAGTFAGLVRMSPWKWLSFSTRNGLSENLVFSITQSGDGTYWFGTGGAGLCGLKDGRWSYVKSVGGSALGSVLCLMRSRDGEGNEVLYAGGGDCGILVGERGRWRPWAHNARLPDPGVFCLAETRDRQGRRTLWAGTRKGLVRAGGGLPERVHLPLASDAVFISALLATQDEAGNPELWAGTRGSGLLCLRNGAWRLLGTAQGLSSDWIQSLHEARDAAGRRRIWVGCNSGGAVELDPSDGVKALRILDTDTNPALPGNTVLQIRSDGLGWLYFFTNKGVLRMDPRDPARRPLGFTTGDGLPSNGCTQGSAFVDARGRIWTGTVHGAAFLDPSALGEDVRAKPLLLESAQVLSDGRDLREGERLSHRRGHIAFSYALLSYHREEDTRYRTQLVGLDREPGKWTARTRMEYPILPEGRYTFRVWARDYAGNLSGPVSLDFTVLPPPWATWWAMGLYGAGGLLAVGAFLRWRTATLRKRNLALEHRIEARTRDLLARNAELEALDGMVQAINREMALQPLLDAILQRSMEHYPAAEKGVILLRDEGSGRFTVHAQRGFDPALLEAFVLTREEALARYQEGTEQLSQGVFLLRNPPRTAGREVLEPCLVPKALLAMSIEFEGGLAGFVLLDNFTDPDAFRDTDVQRMTRFRAHVASAFSKARALHLLEAASHDLRHMNELKNQLLGIVAHDLRNPLNGIVLAAQLIEEEGAEEDLRRLARGIRKEGRDMSELIGRFLDVARIESGHLRAETEPFDLAGTARHALERFRVPAENKGIRLEFEGPGEAVLAYGDPKFTNEVLENLLSNGVKFSPRGGLVRLRIVREGPRVRVGIRDQGPGLTAEDRKRLFGRFARLSAQPTGGERSTGLGLHIVKCLVDAMGGTVRVESEPGKGSEFSVELDAARVGE